MKQTICLMLAILAGLGTVMLAGALIEGGISLPVLLGLAVCALAVRGFYRLGTQPACRARRRVRRRVRRQVRRQAGPAMGFSKKSAGLRAA